MIMSYWMYLFFSVLFGSLTSFAASIMRESKAEGFFLGFFCWPIFICILSVFLLVVSVAHVVKVFIGEDD